VPPLGQRRCILPGCPSRSELLVTKLTFFQYGLSLRSFLSTPWRFSELPLPIESLSFGRPAPARAPKAYGTPYCERSRSFWSTTCRFSTFAVRIVPFPSDRASQPDRRSNKPQDGPDQPQRPSRDRPATPHTVSGQAFTQSGRLLSPHTCMMPQSSDESQRRELVTRLWQEDAYPSSPSSMSHVTSRAPRPNLPASRLTAQEVRLGVERLDLRSEFLQVRVVIPVYMIGCPAKEVPH